MPTQGSLFAGFAPITAGEWRAKIEKDLKGKPYADLQWLLGEGMLLEPYYRKEDVEGLDSSILTDIVTGGWQIGEDVPVHDDLVAANQQALHALMGGVNAPCFLVNNTPSADDLARLTKGMVLDYISIHFKLAPTVDKVAFNASLTELLARKGKGAGEVKGSVMGGAFLSGSLQTLGVDSLPFYAGVAHIPKELACALRAAVDGVMAYADTQPVDDLLDSVFFEVAVDTSYFAAIAKLRALRLLWVRICEGFGQPPRGGAVSARFAPDAYTDNRNENLIRAATLTMSAVLGGADCVTVRPADGEGGAFARRIARNTQHLLQLESGFDQVADPAAGSYYIEKLTHLFVEKAWGIFLEMEASAQ